MNDKDPELKRSIFREWLEKLQQESWQLELLISGFALYGIWAGHDFVLGVQDYINLNRPSLIVDSIPSLAGQFLAITWKIFFMNLLTHVIFRGIWIGTIGLRYVSGEIDYDSLKYSAVMTDYLKRRVGGFDEFIERLEKFCSVLFAYTFLLFFLFLSLIMYLIWFNLLGVLLVQVLDLNPQGTTIVSIILVFLGLGLLVFIDFITFGAFKRIQERRIATIYKYVYIVFSYATLSFLYRPLLYNFIDDKYTKRLILWSIPYFLIVIFFLPGLTTNAPYFPDFNESYYEVDEEMEKEFVKWWNYDDLRKEVKINSKHLMNSDNRIIQDVSLKTYEVDGDYLHFFIRQQHKDEVIFENTFKLVPFNAEGLRHEMSGVMNDNDTPLDEMYQNNREEVKLFRKQHEDLKKNNRELYFEKLDSVTLKFDNERREYLLDKLLSLKKSNFEIYQVFIDSTECTEELESKFFIHPNAGEKGFDCFLTIDSLPKGPHNLSIRRGWRFVDGKADAWDVTNVPFFRK